MSTTPRVPAEGLALIAGLVLLLSAASLEGQIELRASAGAGRVIPVGGFEEGNNLAGRPVRTTTEVRAELAWGWQDRGTGPAEIGVGLSLPRARATDELGTPTAVWGFSRIPLRSGDRSRVTFDAGLGVALGWDAFDPVDNPRQTAIGAPVSAMFRLEVSGTRALTDHLSLVGSAGYQHFSNGNLRPPNLGFNTLPVAVGLAWRLGPDDGGAGGRSGSRSEGMDGDPCATERGGWGLRLLPFGGARGLAADNRHTQQDAVYVRDLFAVAGAHLMASRRVSRRWRVALLLGLTRDASGFRPAEVPALEEGPLPEETGWTTSSGVSGLLNVGPAELEFGVGYEFFDVGGVRDITRLHQRLGAHVLLGDRLRPSIVLRALGFDRPHYIEWGLGLEL